ncbi:MAG: PDZ domain-containing protein [Vicinamibacteria bacterium]
MRRTLVLATALLLSVSSIERVVAQDKATVDRAFDAYWNAGSVKAADKAAEGIFSSGASFATVVGRLADGRAYKTSAETGEIQWPTLAGGGSAHATTVVVPTNYNPMVKYPVRVFLHGGVARPDAPEGEGSGRPNRPRRRMEFKPQYIAVYPSGYADAQWWFFNQVTNLNEILDRLKRSYNIDENRVHLMGVSDGGTGAYFVGAKDPTPWSVLFPLNGSLRVLANPATRADGDIFTTNLRNRPIYAVNGELDPLYPVSTVVPVLIMLQKAGVNLTFRPMAGAGHDTSWWPTEASAIDAFEEDHPRDPQPESLSWETERTDRYNRVSWLVIDRLDPSKRGTTFADSNTIEIQEPADFGLRVDSRRGDGRQVIEIIPGTNAATMGLKKGDIILRMDDSSIRTSGDIGRVFDEHRAGTRMSFEVDRKGQRLTMQGDFPPDPKPPRKEETFKHSRPSGRVDVARKGNTFDARTRGVGAFTLLLAPGAIDFDKPVKVIVNGKVSFDGHVERSVQTLLRYATRDNDRTALFGAELSIQVP